MIKTINKPIAIIIKDDKLIMIDKNYCCVHGEMIEDPVIILEHDEEFMYSIYPTLVSGNKPNYPIFIEDIKKLQKLEPHKRGTKYKKSRNKNERTF